MATNQRPNIQQAWQQQQQMEQEQEDVQTDLEDEQEDVQTDLEDEQLEMQEQQPEVGPWTVQQPEVGPWIVQQDEDSGIEWTLSFIWDLTSSAIELWGKTLEAVREPQPVWDFLAWAPEFIATSPVRVAEWMGIEGSPEMQETLWLFPGRDPDQDYDEYIAERWPSFFSESDAAQRAVWNDVQSAIDDIETEINTLDFHEQFALFVETEEQAEDLLNNLWVSEERQEEIFNVRKYMRDQDAAWRKLWDRYKYKHNYHDVDRSLWEVQTGASERWKNKLEENPQQFQWDIVRRLRDKWYSEEEIYKKFMDMQQNVWEWLTNIGLTSSERNLNSTLEQFVWPNNAKEISSEFWLEAYYEDWWIGDNLSDKNVAKFLITNQVLWSFTGKWINLIDRNEELANVHFDVWDWAMAHQLQKWWSIKSLTKNLMSLIDNQLQEMDETNYDSPSELIEDARKQLATNDEFQSTVLDAAAISSHLRHYWPDAGMRWGFTWFVEGAWEMAGRSFGLAKDRFLQDMVSTIPWVDISESTIEEMWVEDAEKFTGLSFGLSTLKEMYYGEDMSLMEMVDVLGTRSGGNFITWLASFYPALRAPWVLKKLSWAWHSHRAISGINFIESYARNAPSLAAIYTYFEDELTAGDLAIDSLLTGIVGVWDAWVPAINRLGQVAARMWTTSEAKQHVSKHLNLELDEATFRVTDDDIATFGERLNIDKWKTVDDLSKSEREQLAWYKINNRIAEVAWLIRQLQTNPQDINRIFSQGWASQAAQEIDSYGIEQLYKIYRHIKNNRENMYGIINQDAIHRLDETFTQAPPAQITDETTVKQVKEDMKSLMRIHDDDFVQQFVSHYIPSAYMAKAYDTAVKRLANAWSEARAKELASQRRVKVTDSLREEARQSIQADIERWLAEFASDAVNLWWDMKSQFTSIMASSVPEFKNVELYQTLKSISKNLQEQANIVKSTDTASMVANYFRTLEKAASEANKQLAWEATDAIQAKQRGLWTANRPWDREEAITVARTLKEQARWPEKRKLDKIIDWLTWWKEFLKRKERSPDLTSEQIYDDLVEDLANIRGYSEQLSQLQKSERLSSSWDIVGISYTDEAISNALPNYYNAYSNGVVSSDVMAQWYASFMNRIRQWQLKKVKWMWENVQNATMQMSDSISRWAYIGVLWNITDAVQRFVGRNWDAVSVNQFKTRIGALLNDLWKTISRWLDAEKRLKIRTGVANIYHTNGWKITKNDITNLIGRSRYNFNPEKYDGFINRSLDNTEINQLADNMMDDLIAAQINTYLRVLDRPWLYRTYASKRNEKVMAKRWGEPLINAVKSTVADTMKPLNNIHKLMRALLRWNEIINAWSIRRFKSFLWESSAYWRIAEKYWSFGNAQMQQELMGYIDNANILKKSDIRQNQLLEQAIYYAEYWGQWERNLSGVIEDITTAIAKWSTHLEDINPVWFSKQLFPLLFESISKLPTEQFKQWKQILENTQRNIINKNRTLLKDMSKKFERSWDNDWMWVLQFDNNTLSMFEELRNRISIGQELPTAAWGMALPGMVNFMKSAINSTEWEEMFFMALGRMAEEMQWSEVNDIINAFTKIYRGNISRWPEVEWAYNFFQTTFQDFYRRVSSKLQGINSQLPEWQRMSQAQLDDVRFNMLSDPLYNARLFAFSFDRFSWIKDAQQRIDAVMDFITYNLIRMEANKTGQLTAVDWMEHSTLMNALNQIEDIISPTIQANPALWMRKFEDVLYESEFTAYVSVDPYIRNIWANTFNDALLLEARQTLDNVPWQSISFRMTENDFNEFLTTNISYTERLKFPWQKVWQVNILSDIIQNRVVNKYGNRFTKEYLNENIIEPLNSMMAHRTSSTDIDSALDETYNSLRDVFVRNKFDEQTISDLDSLYQSIRNGDKLIASRSINNDILRWATDNFNLNSIPVSTNPAQIAENAQAGARMKQRREQLANQKADTDAREYVKSNSDQLWYKKEGNEEFIELDEAEINAITYSKIDEEWVENIINDIAKGKWDFVDYMDNKEFVRIVKDIFEESKRIFDEEFWPMANNQTFLMIDRTPEEVRKNKPWKLKLATDDAAVGWWFRQNLSNFQQLFSDDPEFADDIFRLVQTRSANIHFKSNKLFETKKELAEHLQSAPIFDKWQLKRYGSPQWKDWTLSRKIDQNEIPDFISANLYSHAAKSKLEKLMVKYWKDEISRKLNNFSESKIPKNETDEVLVTIQNFVDDVQKLRVQHEVPWVFDMQAFKRAYDAIKVREWTIIRYRPEELFGNIAHANRIFMGDEAVRRMQEKYKTRKLSWAPLKRLRWYAPGRSVSDIFLNAVVRDRQMFRDVNNWALQFAQLKLYNPFAAAKWINQAYVNSIFGRSLMTSRGVDFEQLRQIEEIIDKRILHHLFKASTQELLIWAWPITQSFARFSELINVLRLSDKAARPHAFRWALAVWLWDIADYQWIAWVNRFIDNLEATEDFARRHWLNMNKFENERHVSYKLKQSVWEYGDDAKQAWQEYLKLKNFYQTDYRDVLAKTRWSLSAFYGMDSFRELSSIWLMENYRFMFWLMKWATGKMWYYASEISKAIAQKWAKWAFNHPVLKQIAWEIITHARMVHLMSHTIEWEMNEFLWTMAFLVPMIALRMLVLDRTIDAVYSWYVQSSIDHDEISVESVAGFIRNAAQELVNANLLDRAWLYHDITISTIWEYFNTYQELKEEERNALPITDYEYTLNFLKRNFVTDLIKDHYKVAYQWYHMDWTADWTASLKAFQAFSQEDGLFAATELWRKHYHSQMDVFNSMAAARDTTDILRMFPWVWGFFASPNQWIIMDEFNEYREEAGLDEFRKPNTYDWGKILKLLWDIDQYYLLNRLADREVMVEIDWENVHLAENMDVLLEMDNEEREQLLAENMWRDLANSRAFDRVITALKGQWRENYIDNFITFSAEDLRINETEEYNQLKEIFYDLSQTWYTSEAGQRQFMEDPQAAINEFIANARNHWIGDNANYAYWLWAAHDAMDEAMSSLFAQWLDGDDQRIFENLVHMHSVLDQEDQLKMLYDTDNLDNEITRQLEQGSDKMRETFTEYAKAKRKMQQQLLVENWDFISDVPLVSQLLEEDYIQNDPSNPIDRELSTTSANNHTSALIMADFIQDAAKRQWYAMSDETMSTLDVRWGYAANVINNAPEERKPDVIQFYTDQLANHVEMLYNDNSIITEQERTLWKMFTQFYTLPVFETLKDYAPEQLENLLETYWTSWTALIDTLTNSNPSDVLSAFGRATWEYDIWDIIEWATYQAWQSWTLGREEYTQNKIRLIEAHNDFVDVALDLKQKWFDIWPKFKYNIIETGWWDLDLEPIQVDVPELPEPRIDADRVDARRVWEWVEQPDDTVRPEVPRTTRRETRRTVPWSVQPAAIRGWEIGRRQTSF